MRRAARSHNAPCETPQETCNGLTAKRWQSGSSIDVKGRISKAGDPDVRRALYEAASALLTRFKGRDSIKSWGLHLAKTKCHAKARVAVARKLAVVMHAMWRDSTIYVGDPQMTDRERIAALAVKEQRIKRWDSLGEISHAPIVKAGA